MLRINISWLFLFVLAISSGLSDVYAGQWVGFDKIVGALSAGDGKTGTLDLSISFALNSDRLKPAGKAQIEELAKAMKTTRLLNDDFEIAGHTDSSGNAKYNVNLSIRRAKAVERFLSQDLGVNPNRLKTIGWGSKKLKDPLNPTGAINRRVVIKNLSLNNNTPENIFSGNAFQKKDGGASIDW